MIGLELTFDASDVVAQCLERRLLVNATHGHVVRLLPALTITDDQIDEGCAILADVLAGGSRSETLQEAEPQAAAGRGDARPRLASTADPVLRHFVDLFDLTCRRGAATPARPRRRAQDASGRRRRGGRPPLARAGRSACSSRSRRCAPASASRRPSPSSAATRSSSAARTWASASARASPTSPGSSASTSTPWPSGPSRTPPRGAGPARHDPGHQRPLRRRPPVPGDGRHADDPRELRAGSKGSKLVFVGDGNNVARSLAVASALLGVEFVLACPRATTSPRRSRAEFAERFPGVPLRSTHDPRGPSTGPTSSTPTSGPAWGRRARPTSAARSSPPTRSTRR